MGHYGGMNATEPVDVSGFLLRYLQASRDALVWKLDGVTEYDARRPLTGTGVSLAGLVKHAAHTEMGYFGETFGREWPVGEEVITVGQAMDDPQIDFYVAEDETVEQVVDFYRRVWAFSNETFDMFTVADFGMVQHWPPERNRKSLGEIATHVIAETARHAGHADILRERLDGGIGMREDNTNIPDGVDWEAYVGKLQRIAGRYR